MKMIGIDLGISKIALFYIEGEDIHSSRYVADDTSRDLQLRQIASWAYGFCASQDADSVWIEDIIVGNNVKYSLGLAQTMGAVLGEIAHLRHTHGTDIQLVGNKSWKKTIVGNGNANKSEIRNYIDVTHGAYAPLCEGDQDLYDAACVALYGLHVTHQAEGLRL